MCFDDRELRSGHGHVYWMGIEIVMMADNIDMMSARAECGDLWKLQEHSDARHFSKR